MSPRGLVVVFALVFPAVLSIPPAMAEGPYEANWESLSKHEIPGWFQDAKFGIFIHWGVYSVPSWAPRGMYAEWYWRWLGTGAGGIDGSDPLNPTLVHHLNTHGKDKTYMDFADEFKAELFNPRQWADIFAKAGAKYVVLTSKHHDGFCLFPSGEANRSWGRPWNSVDTGPRRDLLGDLSEAVRERGLKMGFYYSLYEWYNPLWQTDRELFVDRHLIPQFKDVVSRYKPALIFADGEWDMPSEQWKSEELIAWLFNESPVGEDVVINDRWGQGSRHVNGDYFTTEYATGMATDDHPWEENRGMGHSYGYNRNESLEDYRTGRELLLMLIDLVSRGGNLLLNVGPAGDGRIPVIMQDRLMEIGRWLEVNGEAIYGTRPWKVNAQWSAGELPAMNYGGEFMVEYDINTVAGPPSDGRAVIDAFFTRKGETVYAITPRYPAGELTLRDIQTTDATEATLLGRGGTLEWKATGNTLSIGVPALEVHERPCENAFVFKITNTRP